MPHKTFHSLWLHHESFQLPNFPLLKLQKKTSLLADLRVAWQRPTLTGGDPQLPSALKSLTSVFGMGTGVTSSPSLPDI